MVPWKSFTFVMSRIQFVKNSRSILRQVLCIYFHQIESVKFIYDNHGQTFLSTRYSLFISTKQISANEYKLTLQYLARTKRTHEGTTLVILKRFILRCDVSSLLDEEKRALFPSQRVLLYFEESGKGT